jgi:phosphoribosylamine--glycine ligase
MRFLVVGQGGREHAIVRALKYSPSVNEVHVVPGNPGMATEAICHAMKTNDWTAWEAFLKKYTFDCVVIGPEVALAEGLADFLRARGIAVVGPNQTAARLESSKIFAKEFMLNAGIPTARSFVVESKDECLQRAKDFQPPYVLKADGLASGKGVLICKTMSELDQACNTLFIEKAFGDAGKKALLEEFTHGYEISYLVLTNGRDFQAMPVAQDHKRLLDGDTGPNTGGMGVVAPVAMSETLRERIHAEIVKPTLRQLDGMGLLYRGVLYFGLMITEKGPSVIEYNVRFGDPEAQVIMPLLDGDWGQVFLNLANSEIKELRWKPLFMACVVMASPGYPDSPEAVQMEGDPQAQTASSYFLHAATKMVDGKWNTGGGRVLDSMGMGSSLKEAIDNAYHLTEKVRWPGVQMRRDIGLKILNSPTQ